MGVEAWHGADAVRKIRIARMAAGCRRAERRSISCSTLECAQDAAVDAVDGIAPRAVAGHVRIVMADDFGGEIIDFRIVVAEFRLVVAELQAELFVVFEIVAQGRQQFVHGNFMGVIDEMLDGGEGVRRIRQTFRENLAVVVERAAMLVVLPVFDATTDHVGAERIGRVFAIDLLGLVRHVDDHFHGPVELFLVGGEEFVERHEITGVTCLRADDFMGVEAFAVEQRVFEAFDDGDFTVLQAHVGFALNVDLVAAVHAVVVRVNWRNAKGFQRGADDFVVVERGHADAGCERLVRFVEDLLRRVAVAAERDVRRVEEELPRDSHHFIGERIGHVVPVFVAAADAEIPCAELVEAYPQVFQRHARVVRIAVVIGAEHELIETAGRIRAVEREAEIEACAGGEKIRSGPAGDNLKCFRQT